MTSQPLLPQWVDARLRNQISNAIAPLVGKSNLPPVLSFGDITGRLKFTKKTTFLPNDHNGQRKLFINELRFITKYIDNKPAFIIYAGGAPAWHTGYLAHLFPKLSFLLVDPAPFDVREANPVFLTGAPIHMIRQLTTAPAGIYIINDLFTNDLARAIHDLLPQVYFISDIRTAIDGARASDMDIIWNSAQQYNWIKIMHPIICHLKFRVAFWDSKLDIDNLLARDPFKSDFEFARANGADFEQCLRKHSFTYFAGDIEIQSWAGETSAETRLITDGSSMRTYGSDYEEAMFYYNVIQRSYIHYANPNANSALHFDHCNDCAIENSAWTNYVQLMGGNVLDYVQHLSKTLHPLHSIADKNIPDD
jgi:cap2 methyltransferase